MNKLEPTIRISRKNAVNNSASKYKGTATTSEAIRKETDRVSLSQTAKVQASLKATAGSVSEIRQDLVNKFKNVLSNGSYEVKANEIADKIVQKIKEHKNQPIF